MIKISQDIRKRTVYFLMILSWSSVRKLGSMFSINLVSSRLPNSIYKVLCLDILILNFNLSQTEGSKLFHEVTVICLAENINILQFLHETHTHKQPFSLFLYTYVQIMISGSITIPPAIQLSFKSLYSFLHRSVLLFLLLILLLPLLRCELQIHCDGISNGLGSN